MSAEEKGAKVTLAQYLASIRRDRKMTLRQVEEATNKDVSNAYLSQIENGKIQGDQIAFELQADNGSYKV